MIFSRDIPTIGSDTTKLSKNPSVGLVTTGVFIAYLEILNVVFTGFAWHVHCALVHVQYIIHSVLLLLLLYYYVQLIVL